MTLLNFLYGGAVAYQKSKSLPLDFTPVDVSDWLDEIGLDKAMDIISDGLKQPKNDLPPQMEGAK